MGLQAGGPYWQPSFCSTLASCFGHSKPALITGDCCNGSSGCSRSPSTGSSGQPTKVSRYRVSCIFNCLVISSCMIHLLCQSVTCFVYQSWFNRNDTASDSPFLADQASATLKGRRAFAFSQKRRNHASDGCLASVGIQLTAVDAPCQAAGSSRGSNLASWSQVSGVMFSTPCCATAVNLQTIGQTAGACWKGQLQTQPGSHAGPLHGCRTRSGIRLTELHVP